LFHLFVDAFDPEKKTFDKRLIVIASKTQGHAVNRLQVIKDVITFSEPFRQLFGYWGKENAIKWTNDEIILKNGSAVVCKGTTQQIRGMNIGGTRPTYIVLDDPEDENNTKTDEAMEGNLRALLQGAVPSLDARGGRICVVGTPITQRCIVETLKEMEDWTTVKYSYVNTRADGTRFSLWPEIKSLQELDELKRSLDNIGRVSVFYKEYMCEITGDEDQLFRPEYIRYYEGEFTRTNDGWYLGVNGIQKAVNLFVGVDPASSTKGNADYSVIMVVAMDRDRNLYVVEYYRRRVSPMVLADAILQMYHKWKPERVNIESVGYQEMLRDYIRTQVFIPGLEVKYTPRGEKKKERLESLETYFASKRVYLKKGMDEFEDELLLFPRASHDDTVDAFWYALRRLYEPVHEDLVTLDGPKNEKRMRYQQNSWLTA